MRARPSSVSASGYVQVNTEEEDFDDGHRPGHHRRRNNQNTRIETRLQRLRKLIPKEPPKGCAKCCAFFSCTGIAFLTILAVLIIFNAPYLKLSPERIENKQELLEAVLGAIMMYLGCFIISTYILYQGPTQREVEDGRFLH